MCFVNHRRIEPRVKWFWPHLRKLFLKKDGLLKRGKEERECTTLKKWFCRHLPTLFSKLKRNPHHFYSPMSPLFHLHRNHHHLQKQKKIITQSNTNVHQLSHLKLTKPHPQHPKRMTKTRGKRKFHFSEAWSREDSKELGINLKQPSLIKLQWKFSIMKEQIHPLLSRNQLPYNPLQLTVCPGKIVSPYLKPPLPDLSTTVM